MPRLPAPRVLLSCVMLMLPVTNASAQTLPKWEVSAGLTGLYLPDYPGADQGRSYLLPLPILIYRGERLRSDRDGVRAQLLQNDRLDLNLSLGGSLPVRAERNAARQGMPELPPVVEIGPALNVRLARWDDERVELQLRLPVRWAIAFDGGPDNFGGVASPHLRLQQHRAPWLFGANVGLGTGPWYGTRGFNHFYYGVDPQYATPARPAYQARSGYAGWSTWASATTPRGRWRGFVFASANALGNTVVADSPLLKRTVTYSVGLGVGYVFAQSAEQVEDLD